jgi:DNA topoisomerase-3
MSTSANKIDTSNVPSRKSKYAKSYPKKGTKKSTSGVKNKSSKKKTTLTECICPKCKKGTLLKGKSAYGCSQWNADCDFKLPFAFMEKRLSENQLLRLMSKGSTVTLKGFKRGSQKVDGIVRFDSNYQLSLIPPKAKMPKRVKPVQKKSSMICPKCGKGQVLKGKSAYGCSAWKSGCDFRFPFDELIKRIGNRNATASLVKDIISG